MRHAGTRRLETKRLILRRFVMEDARAMFENWASDEEVTRYLTWPPRKSPEVTRSVLETWTSSYADQSFYKAKQQSTTSIGAAAPHGCG